MPRRIERTVEAKAEPSLDPRESKADRDRLINKIIIDATPMRSGTHDEASQSVIHWRMNLEFRNSENRTTSYAVDVQWIKDERGENWAQINFTHHQGATSHRVPDNMTLDLGRKWIRDPEGNPVHARPEVTTNTIIKWIEEEEYDTICLNNGYGRELHWITKIVEDLSRVNVLDSKAPQKLRGFVSGLRAAGYSVPDGQNGSHFSSENSSFTVANF